MIGGWLHVHTVCRFMDVADFGHLGRFEFVADNFEIFDV
jgi:hypothetical protein